MIIAIDFDGVLAKPLFPKIGAPIKENIDAVKSLLQSDTCILWTSRTGQSLTNAVNWCDTQGLHFEYVNENTPENIKKYGDSRKVYADLYIDDKSSTKLPQRKEVIEMEQRTINEPVELRDGESEESEPIIRGYALKFDSESQMMGKSVRFREKIDRHALDHTDMSNVVALFNHDRSQILGRSGKNLKLEVDDVGLRYEMTPLKTTVWNDLLENVRSGVISQSSFGFTLPDTKEAQSWTKSGDHYERTLKQIDRLIDVSPVTTPAYEATEVTVGQRSLDMIHDLDGPDLALRKRKLLLEADL